MDRNLTTLGGSGVGSVALRKESVDRNLLFPVVAGFLTTVALRKESVDRNTLPALLFHPKPTVALRKESVDRNSNG